MSLIERHDAGEIETNSSAGESSNKGNVNWTEERKTFLARGTYHHRGHLSTDLSKKAKWICITKDLYDLPQFAGQPVVEPEALKNTFLRFMKNELDHVTKRLRIYQVTFIIHWIRQSTC